jgi:glycosyltransferase involved in cell wall biosynthesis
MTTIAPPLISVIIPLYNAEKYISECITSVLNQSWPNIEVIVVDDGSKDNSLAVAKSFECDNVKVFSQENKGASAARNKGLAVAKGDYIQFLDADDLLKNDKLFVALESMEGHSNAISVCPVVHFSEQTANELEQLKPNAYELLFYKNSADPFDFLMNLYGAEDNKGSMIPLHCWLTPTALIKKAGQWDESLTVNDDGEFFCRVVLQAQQIVFTDKTVCYYRKYSGNASLSAGKNITALYSQYKAILLQEAHLAKHKTDERIDRVIVRLLMGLLMIAYPADKSLSKKIQIQIKQHKVKAIAPPIGGAKIELIKKIFGWKVARNLQYYLSR